MRKAIYNEIDGIKTHEQPLFDTEKERIMLHLKKEIRGKRPARAVLKTLSAAAACFMLLFVVGVSTPVLAENIPFIKEIVSFLKQEQTPMNSVIRESDTEKYTQPVSDLTEDELQILETYCDGTALIVTAGLELPGIDEDILRIFPDVTVDINNERLFPTENPNLMPAEGEGRRLGMFIFHRTDGDRFVGALAMDISHLELTKDFDFTLTLTKLTGENPKLMLASSDDPSDPIYQPKQYALGNETVPHTVTVSVDTSRSRTYNVEKAIGELTVHKLITTPLCTYLDISRPENTHYYYTVTTDSGKKLGYNKFDNAGTVFTEWYNMKLYRDPLPEGTKSVNITVYSPTDDITPLGTVEIPVEFGYASITEERTVMQIPEDEIVYDPPLEELLAQQPEIKQYALGETVTSREGREPNADGLGYENEDATVEITYDNMQVYDSPAEIDLDVNDLSNIFRGGSVEKSGMKFVTFDVEMKINGIYGHYADDDSYRAEIDAYAENDGTAGVLWINSYAIPEGLAESEPYMPSEIAYFSLHPTGTSNYYQFVTNAHDTHSFTLGFYVPDELLESGNWRIGIMTGENDPNSGAKYVYYTVPPVSLTK